MSIYRAPDVRHVDIYSAHIRTVIAVHKRPDRPGRPAGEVVGLDRPDLVSCTAEEGSLPTCRR